MDSFRCLVLAAGEGTRMKSSIAKVLQPVCGKPMLGYILNMLKNVGIKNKEIIVVINTKNQGREVERFLGNKFCVVEQKKLLGTADAVNQSGKLLSNYKGNLLVLCGDTPLLTETTVNELVNRHVNTDAFCTLLTAFIKNPTGYGRIVRDSAGRINRIVEERDASVYEKAIEEVNTGIYCFKSAEMFSALKEIKPDNVKKEFYLTDIIRIFHKQGLKVESVTTRDFEEVLGINTKVQLAEAQAVVCQRILRRLMEEGITIIDPKSTFIDEEVSIGRDTVIYPNVIIEGNTHVGKNCKIGPFCRIREGCNISDGVVVGNFAELVRVDIGGNTKINHQCYLADAHIGSGVNIGAGVIIANYDGKGKYHSFIEEGAFIGSGAILISPVTIGSRAVCGAGAVITKNKKIEANSTVIGVPSRVLRKSKSAAHKKAK